MSKEGNGILAEQTKISETENEKRIDNHRKGATDLEYDKKYQHEAIRNHQNGNREKRSSSTNVANGKTGKASTDKK